MPRRPLRPGGLGGLGGHFRRLGGSRGGGPLRRLEHRLGEHGRLEHGDGRTRGPSRGLGLLRRGGGETDSGLARGTAAGPARGAVLGGLGLGRGLGLGLRGGPGLGLGLGLALAGAGLAGHGRLHTLVGGVALGRTGGRGDAPGGATTGGAAGCGVLGGGGLFGLRLDGLPDDLGVSVTSGASGV